ncbi:MAG: PadR family transcriptional regulator [Thermoproteus sp.]
MPTRAYLRFRNCIGKGNLWLYVVAILLREGPLHGYGIISRLRSLGFGISNVYGYVLLKRMVTDGVLAEKEEAGGRKVYVVSEEGLRSYRIAVNEMKNLLKFLEAEP